MTPAYPFCNVIARGHGLDPVGHAPSVDMVLGFEMRLPWPYALWDAPALPDGVRELVRVWYADPSVPRPRLRPVSLAPEPAGADASGPGASESGAAEADDGLRFVALWSRPRPPFARYDGAAYRVPAERVGDLALALLLRPGELPAFERWRVADGRRHLMVCTHGAVDAACGKFGYPAYRALRDAAPAGTRVWRASHFGGHLFAPTILDLPTARYWAFVDGEAAAALLADGDPRALRDRYRGWGALGDPFVQAAEREAWLRHGAAWPTLPRTGSVVRREEGPEPRWAEVRLEAADADGGPRTFLARVERTAEIRTPHTSSSDETRPYAQYAVTSARWSR